MDPWKANDVIKFKILFKEDFKQVEKALYDPLADWIQHNLPGTIYLDPGEFGVDVIVNANDLFGFEVKIARPYKGHIDATPLFQGIGQAIWYLRRGMDYSYLVVPLLDNLPYFTDLFCYATKCVGLVVFDRRLEFQRIRAAERASYTDYSSRKVVLELLARHRSGPANLRLRRIKEKWGSYLTQ